jgi:hypothetical protein
MLPTRTNIQSSLILKKRSGSHIPYQVSINDYINTVLVIKSLKGILHKFALQKQADFIEK